MILFGHPTGNPNSHNACLAHFEAGRLAAFVVPWFPSAEAVAAARIFGPTRGVAARLARRRFEPLAGAPKLEGRLAEFRRLLIRALGRGDERLSYEANDWVMRTMANAAPRQSITAVHAYEDAALDSFQVAKRLGKACLYDMPIGYYPAWEQTQAELVRRYRDWLPPGGLPSSSYVRPDQKRREMALADLVLVPSEFVEKTIRTFLPDKPLSRATYGVDLDFWSADAREHADGPLRFIFAGQLSLRKGIPLLLEAWKGAELGSAELDLVGLWQMAPSRRDDLPRGVNIRPPCSREELRSRLRRADVLVLPSYFEGFPLVLLEAMACGLPAIATTAAADREVLPAECGRIVPIGDCEQLVEALRWFDSNRDRIPFMSRAARVVAERWTWENYRRSVSEAVARFT